MSRYTDERDAKILAEQAASYVIADCGHGERTPAMTSYVVYRHGANSDNQPLTDVMPIGIWDAPDAATAKALAAEVERVWANQHLTTKRESRASYSDINAAELHQIKRDEHEQMVREYQRDLEITEADAESWAAALDAAGLETSR